MKQILYLIFFMSCGYCMNAQTMQEAKTRMYYERYNSASELLRNVIKHDPRNTEAWYLLTRCYLKDDKIPSFWDTVPTVPADLVNAPYIECAKGDVLLRHGKRDSAAILFNAALSQSRQKDPAILSAVAIAHIRADSGDATYALDLLSKAIKLDKKNPVLYVEQGNAYRRLENGTEAYKAYTKAIDTDPTYAEALYRLGKLFVAQNNPDMYLKYFRQATIADSSYAPAWYALYYHYYFKDPAQAMVYLNRYISVSDPDPVNKYRKTDLLYLTKNYPAAIREADALVSAQNYVVDPKLFKLLAYSYDELNDSVKALDHMRTYFEKQPDSSLIPKDFESMANMYSRFPGKEDSAAIYLSRAIGLEKDSIMKMNYYKNIADLYKKINDYKNQSVWLGRYYQSNPKAGNIDLFNWGISSYLAKNYSSADSIFTLYSEKYPGQTFGYYWKARADIAIDTTMEKGLAVPCYKEVIKLSTQDSTGHPNKKWLIEAYGYMAAYEANTEKNYSDALEYLENLLVQDPDNTSAKKYIEILKKNNARSAVSKNK
jgi:tetratricopeptide (TPR) repeat protein